MYTTTDAPSHLDKRSPPHMPPSSRAPCAAKYRPRCTTHAPARVPNLTRLPAARLVPAAALYNRPRRLRPLPTPTPPRTLFDRRPHLMRRRCNEWAARSSRCPALPRFDGARDSKDAQERRSAPPSAFRTAPFGFHCYLARDVVSAGFIFDMINNDGHTYAPNYSIAVSFERKIVPATAVFDFDHSRFSPRYRVSASSRFRRARHFRPGLLAEASRYERFFQAPPRSFPITNARGH
ncbi:hypothetical protein B0H13DRAFT_2332297 [Mycena leptocephala]|nr:hypothetical protein B0H13DRAFT_2332297 [Mycena leptocephala]